MTAASSSSVTNTMPVACPSLATDDDAGARIGRWPVFSGWRRDEAAFGRAAEQRRVTTQCQAEAAIIGDEVSASLGIVSRFPASLIKVRNRSPAPPPLLFTRPPRRLPTVAARLCKHRQRPLSRSRRCRRPGSEIGDVQNGFFPVDRGNALGHAFEKHRISAGQGGRHRHHR